MPREKASYRDTIALMNELAPGSLFATLDECKVLLHYKSKTSVLAYLKRHGIKHDNGRVNKAELARSMCS